MIEIVIQRLLGITEVHHILLDGFGIFVFYQDARHKVRDGFHVDFVHPQAGDFDGAHAQSAGAVPVFGFVFRDQVLVGDEVSFRQAVGDFQSAAKFFDARDHLLSLGVTLVCT